MDDDRPATTSFSFSRFGRRLDQKKTTSSRFHTPNVSTQLVVQIKKKSPTKVDWLFRRIDRSQGSTYLPKDKATNAARDYKPHFEIIEKHIPTVSFEKQTKRRSMSLSSNQYDSATAQTLPAKVKLMIPFDKQEGRKDITRQTVDKFYQPLDIQRTNNAHSFESYSARKPLTEKDAMPDYEIQKSFNFIKTRRSTGVDFTKISKQKDHIPITALLDYDVKLNQKIRTVCFDKQLPRDKKEKKDAFKKLFQRLQEKVQ